MSTDPTSRRDTVFVDPAKAETPFRFSPEISAAFDDMAARSIPAYRQTLLFSELLAADHATGLTACDVGCSTGTLAVAIAQRLGPHGGAVLGVDLEPSMLDRARERAAASAAAGASLAPLRWSCGDVRALEPPASDTIFVHWTLQFLPVVEREVVLARLFAALRPGGALVLSEKVRASTEARQRTMDTWYDGFKLANGYSRAEIEHKRRALAGTLIPLTLDENLALVERAGGARAEVVFLNVCFATVVAWRP